MGPPLSVKSFVLQLSVGNRVGTRQFIFQLWHIYPSLIQNREKTKINRLELFTLGICILPSLQVWGWEIYAELRVYYHCYYFRHIPRIMPDTLYRAWHHRSFVFWVWYNVQWLQRGKMIQLVVFCSKGPSGLRERRAILSLCSNRWFGLNPGQILCMYPQRF